MRKCIRTCFLALCILCTLIGICGCSKPETLSETPEESFAKMWGFGGALHTDDVIPNEETAVSVATAIFSNIQKQPYYSDLVFNRVYYHAENEAWIVLFSPKAEEGTVTAGGGCTIILRKSDGCVLGIVSGE
jgi:hypothetical protein